MKSWVAVLVTGILVGTAYTAAAQGLAGVAVKSEGRWEVLCQVLTRGNLKYFQLDQSRTEFSDSKFSLADCKYRAAAASDLEISVTGPEECPFPGASAGACTTTIPAGKSGSFKFRVNH